MSDRGDSDYDDSDNGGQDQDDNVVSMFSNSPYNTGHCWGWCSCPAECGRGRPRSCCKSQERGEDHFKLHDEVWEGESSGDTSSLDLEERTFDDHPLARGEWSLQAGWERAERAQDTLYYQEVPAWWVLRGLEALWTHLLMFLLAWWK